MPDIVDKNGVWTLQPDADFANFELEEIDLTDGTWNFIDIDNRISATGFSDGANKVVTNAISAGNENQITNTTSQNVPRWYRTLTDANGVELTTGDSFIFISTLQVLSSSNPRKYGFGVGLSVNPIGTGSGDNSNCIQGQGQRQGWMFHAITNKTDLSFTQLDGHIYSAGSTVIGNLLNTSSVQTYVNNFGNTNGGNSVSYNNVDQGRTKSNETINPTTSSIFLQVGFGARFNSSAAASNTEHKQKLKFKVIRLKS